MTFIGLHGAEAGPWAGFLSEPKRLYVLQEDLVFSALNRNPLILSVLISLVLFPSPVLSPAEASVVLPPPSLLTSFTGPSFNASAGSSTSLVPPDPTIAVGPLHVVVGVNQEFRIYDKTGVKLVESSFSSWFASSGFGPGSGFFLFDPKVIFDTQAARFVLLVDAKNNATQQSDYLVSSSISPSAVGGWCNRTLDMKLNIQNATSTPGAYWADFPGLGYDPTAVYMTANMFRFAMSPTPVYSKIRIVAKSQLYDCSQPLNLIWDFWGGSVPADPSVPASVSSTQNADGSNASTIMPAQQQVSPGPMVLVNALAAPSTKITLWAVTQPLFMANDQPGPNPCVTPPPSSAYVCPRLVRETVIVNQYTLNPNAIQQDNKTIPNPTTIKSGTPQMLNAVYRLGTLWTVHDSSATIAGITVAAIQWFQLNVPCIFSGTPFFPPPSPCTPVLQQQTFAAKGVYRYYPAIMLNHNPGNAFLVFAESGSKEHPGVRFTGRLTTDPNSTMRSPTWLKPGQSVYVLNPPKWGDFYGITWDPSTDNVWIFGEYAMATGTWGTWIGQISF